MALVAARRRDSGADASLSGFPGSRFYLGTGDGERVIGLSVIDSGVGGWWVHDMARSKTSGCAWLALVLAIVGGYYVVKAFKETPHNPVAHRENTMIADAQAAVRKSLKDSQTADFDYRSIRLHELEGGGMIVTGSVRAANSFGAFIETPWAVEMSEDGKVVSVRVE